METIGTRLAEAQIRTGSTLVRSWSARDLERESSLARGTEMTKVASSIRGFFKEEEGATMVEYGIMIALIAAICVAIIATLGTQVKAGFTTTSAALPAA